MLNLTSVRRNLTRASFRKGRGYYRLEFDTRATGADIRNSSKSTWRRPCRDAFFMGTEKGTAHRYIEFNMGYYIYIYEEQIY